MVNIVARCVLYVVRFDLMVVTDKSFFTDIWVNGWRVVTAVGTVLFLLAGCGSPYDEIANLDSQGATVVCFGDSLTRGVGASQGGDYPARMAELLPGLPVINAGRDGDTTGSALARLQRDVLDEDPLMVIVLLGGNDVLNRVPEEETLDNLDRIVGRCVDAGAMVVLVHAKYGVFKDPYRGDFTRIAKKHGAVLAPNVLKDILGNPRAMSDQIHPNNDGYAVMASRIAQVVEPVLLEARGRPDPWKVSSCRLPFCTPYDSRS